MARPDASSLQRSAVMLTGAADAADQLVKATLHRVERSTRRAGRSRHQAAGSEPDLLVELVRQYLRSSSRRLVDRVEPPGAAIDAGDVLDSLRPRQRAAAVLMLVQGWSAEHTARVLGVPPRHIPSLVPQTVGLADALHAMAYHHYGPVQDHFTAALTEPPREPDGTDRGSSRPAADDHMTGSATPGPVPTRKESGRRSRAVRRSAAGLLLTLGGLATVALLSGQDDSSPRPDADGSAAASADLSGRGWVLDPRGDPPPFLEGLRLIDVATIDYADATRPLILDTLPRQGRAMYAALWCDMPPRDIDLVPPTVTLTLAGHTVAIPCAGKRDDPPVQRLIPLPPPGERGRVRAGLEWDGDLPGRGNAVLATYTEFGQNEPPRAGGLMPQAPPPVPQDSTVLDSDRVPVQIEGGELFVQRVTVSSTTHLSIWSAGTGTFTIIVDGVVASDDGDLRPAPAVAGSAPELVWQNQDPQLRDGFWTIHAPGQTLQFPLPEAMRPSPGQERQVSIQVLVGTGSQGPWQVQASHAAPVLSHAPPFPQTTVHLMTRTADR